MELTQVKDLFSIFSSAATVVAAGAALYWFLFTRSFKRRIQFDVDLKIFDAGEDHDFVAELVLTIDNKGQREHHLYNLWCEVRQTRALANTSEARSYLPVQNLVPESLTYFFIPAGVNQKFPKTFTIPRDEKLVRTMAVFTYDKKRLDLSRLDHLTFEELDRVGSTTHSVSKLFEVKPNKS